jgi:hypothetical protein
MTLARQFEILRRSLPSSIAKGLRMTNFRSHDIKSRDGGRLKQEESHGRKICHI